MTYRKLSEVVTELSNPQRSDTFVKKFREAVREGKFDAMNLPERFAMPKRFRRRDNEDTYQRPARDMLFEVTPAFTKWFEETQTELQTARRSSRVKLSLEAVEAGHVDFKAMAEETRRKMQASFAKGQALGQFRAKSLKKKK